LRVCGFPADSGQFPEFAGPFGFADFGIGENIHEAQYAQSKADFVSKTAISQKETFETIYWLKVLFRTEYINETEYKSLYSDAEEIMRILSRIIVSSKSQNLK